MAGTGRNRPDPTRIESNRLAPPSNSQAISNKVLAELKQTFLEAYDENADGKIDIREVSQVAGLRCN